MIVADELKLTKNENSIEYNLLCYNYESCVFPIYDKKLYPMKCTVEIYGKNNKKIHTEDIIINYNDDCIILKEFTYKFLKNTITLQKTDILYIYRYKIFTKQTISVEYSNMIIEGKCTASKYETTIGTNIANVFLKPHKNENGIEFKIVEFN